MAKIICIVTARNSSSRLKNKALLKIGNKTVLQRVINRVKAVNLLAGKELINHIVVAVPADKKSKSILFWCVRHRIDYFVDSSIKENDVLTRVYECAKRDEADYIVRITADCPFFSPEIVTALLLKPMNCEYQALPFNRGKIPDGWDCEIIKFDLLEKAKYYTKGKDREHWSQWIRRHNHKNQDDWDISLEDLDFRKLKLSLDTKKDLKFLRRYEKLL